MYLEFADFGVATAYVNLALSAVADEIQHIESLKIGGRLLRLIGQGDLALSIAEDEFRKLLSGKYPDRRSQAFSLNWNFTVPYVSSGPVDASRWKQDATTDGTTLSFFQHLRLRRSVFAYPDAEAKTIEALRRLLLKHGIDAAILAGLGWSDIIIDGRIRVDQMREFAAFVVEAHELHLPLTPGNLPVFQRILTLFGYTPGHVPTAGELRHVTFVRCVPGRLAEGQTTLRKAFPSMRSIR